MRIFVSQAFRSYASAKVVADLVDAFKWWKESTGREFQSPIFGKDAALFSPKVGGRAYALRHCHLVPLNDANALKAWARSHRFGSRKVSDRVLIYVQQDDDFLLIDIVDDPGAHALMRMTDKQGKSFMLKCAEEAEAFFDGRLKIHRA